MAKRKPTPEERRELRTMLVEIRTELGTLREQLEAKVEAARQLEARRRARLRRLSFGLLGRSSGRSRA
jgi:hypothetical protein